MGKQRAQILDRLKGVSKWVGLYPHLAQIRRTYNVDGYNKQRLEDQSRLYKAFIEPGDLRFDVGANVGRKTEAFLNLGAKVAAFEPQFNSAKEIRLRCDGIVSLSVEECAIGKKESTVNLDLNTRSGLARAVSRSVQ